MLREAARKHGSILTLAQGDARDLGFIPDSSIDVVVSLFGSLSHCLELGAVLEEIWRVLKPGGKGVVMLYSRFALGNLLKSLSRGSFQYLDAQRNYSIRNGDDELGSPANFYSVGSVAKAFRLFGNFQIVGLNATCDMLLPSWGRRKISPFLLERFLTFETRLLSVLSPNFAHSLLVEFRK